MQTDPNFANFCYQEHTGRLVLLDFGAARTIDPATAQGYRRLLVAILANDRSALREAAIAVGLIGAGAAERHEARLDRMIEVALQEIQRDGPFDRTDEPWFRKSAK